MSSQDIVVIIEFPDWVTVEGRRKQFQFGTAEKWKIVRLFLGGSENLKIEVSDWL